MRKPEIEKRIVEFLQKEYKKAFNYKQIAFAIGATNPANRLDVINILDTLAEADSASIRRKPTEAQRTSVTSCAAATAGTP